jgi:hypothetical protein
MIRSNCLKEQIDLKKAFLLSGQLVAENINNAPYQTILPSDYKIKTCRELSFEIC